MRKPLDKKLLMAALVQMRVAGLLKNQVDDHTISSEFHRAG